MSKVHIILSTYNGESYVEAQIESILNGTYQDIHIEVSDDGSTDRTVDLIKKMITKYPDKLSLHVNEKNMGYTKNFLYAVTRAEGEYIMFCDQDDIWMEDKVETSLNALQNSEEQGKPTMIFTDAWLYDNDTKETMGLFQKNSHYNSEKVDIAHLLIENKCIGCTIMMNQYVKDYLQQIPDEIRVHDWWIALICSAFGSITYVDKPTLYYRQHSANMIGGTSYGGYMKNRLSRLKEQRQTLVQCYEQGEAFLRLFDKQLNDKQKKTIEAFSTMKNIGFFRRKVRLFHYHFWKSGVTRNIGVLLLA